MITNVMTTGQIDLPFAVNVNMASSEGESNSVNIAFTDFNLTPTTSDIDFIFMLSLPSFGEGFHFGLGAQDICISPDGFGNEAKLYLSENIEIPIDGEVELSFNGGQTPIDNEGELITEQIFYSHLIWSHSK